jgi:hypothetical protein
MPAALNTGNYSLIIAGDLSDNYDNVLASYRGRTVMVGGTPVAIPDTAGLAISSAYRNPQRNRAIPSNFACSRHVMGRALDVAPIVPVTVMVGGTSVDLDLHSILYPALRDAGADAVAGGSSICEDGGVQVTCGDATEDHVHVQW